MLNLSNMPDLSSVTKGMNLKQSLTKGTGSVTNNAVTDSDVTVLDTSWVMSRFMVPDKELPDDVAKRRYWSSVKFKFTSSSLGNNIAINTRPQFTRYADIRSGLSLGHNSGNPKEVNSRTKEAGFGMGRYYSESIDDNQQLVYLTFGVPKFNNLLSFFTRAVSYEDSYIANHGRLPTGYTVGQVAGGILMLAAFPLITITLWAVKTITKIVLGGSTLDYYYMEPTMHTYWSAVNTIVTNLATEMGILIPSLMEEKADTMLKENKRTGMPVQLNRNDMDELRKYFPTLISDNNYIDIFAIATRSQTIVNQQMLLDKEKFYDMDENAPLDPSLTEQSLMLYNDTIASKINSTLSFNNFLNIMTGGGKPSGDGTNNSDEKPFWENKVDEQSGAVQDESLPATDPNTPPTSTSSAEDNRYSRSTKNADEYGTYPNDPHAPVVPDGTKSYIEKAADAADAAFRDGGLFAIFNVDYTGSPTDSFSNSLTEIESAGMINSVTSSVRNMRFNLSNGNIAGDTIDSLLGGAKNVLMGAADSITFGLSNVVAGVLGGAYVDLPKVWDSSDASINQTSYSIQLVSPYGNPISQLQNIYIPLAMLLAGALPISAGGSSHASPFLCSAYSKGIQNIKLGMITSLSITRGTTNLPFNKNFKPLAYDVSFTVSEFSNIVTLPITASIFSSFQASFEDNSPMGKYIALLSSRDIMTNKYFIPKIKIKASRAAMTVSQGISAASWGLRVGEFTNKYLGGFVNSGNLTPGYNQNN